MKPFWKSKTLWLNALAMAILIVQYLQGQVWFSAELQVLILAILNAGLRFITNTAIGSSSPSP